MAYIEDINLSGDIITGRTGRQSGVINLTADLDAGTLTGSTKGLEVNGRMSGSDLAGGVSYRGVGVGGGLDGLVGSDQAIGAFHGNDADLIYSGGFLTEAP